MTIFKVLLLLFGTSLFANGRVIDVDEFEDFLKQSVSGTLQEPFTPELEVSQNIWERSGKFEGDILLSNEQIKTMVDIYSGKRNIVTPSRRHWTNGIIYYDYTEGEFDAGQIQAVEDALRIIESSSCIKFVRRQNERNFVRVTTSSSGCFSMVGEMGGSQQLNLMSNEPGVGCFRQGVIIHEFLHAVGFYHQQSTHNRNEWVKIIWNKIIPSARHNFLRYPKFYVTNYDVEYDYGSIMHYTEYAASIDGSKTIEPLKETDETLGQLNGMSKGDIRKLNLLYKCIPE